MSARILVVDDEESLRTTLAEILEDEGYEVHTAALGEEALGHSSIMEFDLLIMDMRMPGMSGLEVLETLRAEGKLGRAILMSAYAMEDTKRRAMAMGALAFLDKPVDVDHLLTLVHQGDRVPLLLVSDDAALAARLVAGAPDSCRITHVETLRGAARLCADVAFRVILLDCRDQHRSAAAACATLRRAAPGARLLALTDDLHAAASPPDVTTLTLEQLEGGDALGSALRELAVGAAASPPRPAATTMPEHEMAVPGGANRQRVLVVEDDAGQRETLCEIIDAAGFETEGHATAAAALGALGKREFAVAIVDLRLPDASGLDFLPRLRERHPRLQLIVHTGHSSLDSAVESVNLGVHAYLEKGGDPELLLQRVQGAARAHLSAALRDSQEKLQRIADNALQLIAYVDRDERYRFMNQRYAEWFAQPVEEMLGRSMADIGGEAMHLATREFMARALAGERVNFSAALGFPDGVVREMLTSYIPDQDGEGSVRGLFVMASDETERRRAEQALRESEARFRATYEQSVIGIGILDERGRVTDANRALQTLLGYDRDHLATLQPGDLVHADDLATAAPLNRALFSGERDHFQLQLRLQRSDGETVWVNSAVSAVRDDTGRVSFRVLMVDDITEARRLSQELSYQASHDALTGLVNRREFEHRLHRVLDSMAPDTEHALCYMDLDQFKLINDTSGHIAGDELLRQLGTLLRTTVRKRDTLARLGGDEFGLLMEHCPLDQAIRVAESIRSSIENFRFFWEDRTYKVGVSVGLVPIRSTEQTLSDILRAADSACYAAKDQGRNRVHVFREDDQALARRSSEIHWAERLNHALQHDEFELHYQAVQSLGAASGEGERFEVLLRLREADGSLTLPGAFLPAAERYGIGAHIDRWVVEQVLRWLGNAPARLDALELCAINLGAQFIAEPQCAEGLLAGLAAHGVPPHKICFEIAESVAISNLGAAQHLMRTLSAAGCRTALDDFGNGLSSIAYLRTLPVDFLKIDGLLVREMLDDALSLAMIRAINDIARVMGKQVVAEFAESEALLAELRAVGVHYAQGHAVGKPQPIDRGRDGGRVIHKL